MKIHKSWIPALAVAVVSLTTGGWLLQQGGASQESVVAKARLLESVHRLVSERYVEKTDPAELYQMAIDGMLEELGDPHTVFMDSAEFADLELSTTGNYGGLGIRIQARDDWVTVMGVLPNTPAEREGLQTGDRILSVEGHSAEGWNDTDAIKALRGPKGSVVEVTVGRVGINEPLTFNITRAEIHVEAIKAFMLDDRVGFVRLESFSKRAKQEVQAAIDSLRAQGAKALIFDLRANPGGLLDEGVAIADIFLPKGAEVVSTRSRLEDQNFSFRAPDDGSMPSLPVVVLVNGFSASASEIVAGALQDHDRALVVGETTFGKGSVQTLYSLPGGNHLKMTTARWYTPSGRSIQKDRSKDATMREAIAAARERDHGESGGSEEKSGQKQGFKTDGGRVVLGGGGIHPDLVVHPDTLSLGVRKFAAELTRQKISLDNAAFKFAVSWTADHPGLKRDFTITPAMREAFFRQLDALTEAPLDRESYRAASRIVDYKLGFQIANAAYGETERLIRQIRGDRQVETGQRLLDHVKTTAELLALGEAEARAAEARAAAEVGSERAALEPISSP